MMPRRAFEAAFPEAEAIDWTGKDEDCPAGWREGETVRVAEYWVREAVMQIPGVKSCNVELVFDPPWDASRMSDEAKLQLNMF